VGPSSHNTGSDDGCPQDLEYGDGTAENGEQANNRDRPIGEVKWQQATII
jgi:hypothetical protein